MEHMLSLATKISDGANSFLFKEYGYMIVFCILFGIVIFFLAETNMGEFWTVIAFEVGAATSIISGFIGMRIAVTSFQLGQSNPNITQPYSCLWSVFSLINCK
jgi:Na+/H+-translocating membrane pyrophosphatase